MKNVTLKTDILKKSEEGNMQQKRLLRIAEKYQKMEGYKDNFLLGGGLAEYKFASRRHEDAINDPGKETLGKVVQIFKRATGLPVIRVKEIIKFAKPDLEWHHAGKLPSRYGGGMKKTYFLNCNQIVDLALKWDYWKESLEGMESDYKRREEAKAAFLKEHAVYVERVTEEIIFMSVELEEMKGKYGWFPANYEYNLEVYYSGWKFKSLKDLDKYNNIKYL